MSDRDTHYFGDGCPGGHIPDVASDGMRLLRRWDLPVEAAEFGRELLMLATARPDGRLEDIDGRIVLFYAPESDDSPGS